MMPDEIELYRKEQIEDMICTMYGGRVAEELFLGTITTGAQDDFQKATQLAKHYVGVFGMSKEFGCVSGIDYSSPFGAERKTLYSAHTAKVIVGALNTDRNSTNLCKSSVISSMNEQRNCCKEELAR